MHNLAVISAPSSRYETAARNIADGFQVIEEWEALGEVGAAVNVY